MVYRPTFPLLLPHLNRLFHLRRTQPYSLCLFLPCNQLVILLFVPYLNRAHYRHYSLRDNQVGFLLFCLQANPLRNRSHTLQVNQTLGLPANHLYTLRPIPHRYLLNYLHCGQLIIQPHCHRVSRRAFQHRFRHLHLNQFQLHFLRALRRNNLLLSLPLYHLHSRLVSPRRYPLSSPPLILHPFLRLCLRLDLRQTLRLSLQSSLLTSQLHCQLQYRLSSRLSNRPSFLLLRLPHFHQLVRRLSHNHYQHRHPPCHPSATHRAFHRICR